MDFKYVGIKSTEICIPCYYLVKVLEMAVNPSLTKIKSQPYNIILLSHYERILTLSLMFMTSYICKKSAHDSNISENDHKKYDENVCAKKEKSKILTKS